ncbi:ParD family antitoxin [Rahnella aquatilis CIP 78.65 = ATCC 33071]|nr:ParD family antitoxin [Rahnella aquatilis CIP 78.65 = ATCC 33071]
MLSIEDYQMLEEIKMRLLKEKVARAEADIAHGDVMDGETFFAQLMSGKRD